MEFKPQRIGNFLFLERLASGGMCEVYRALALGAGRFQKQLAIKRILPSFGADEEFQQMFEYEAQLASRLTHSNIVEVYDFVKLEDTYLLAMEYVEGQNARALLSRLKELRRPSPLEYGLFVINEVCKGLEYAHTRKDAMTGEPLHIVHRDISPENVMISYEGDVKIVDFGIARARDRVSQTHPDTIKGKLGYLAPEQAEGLGTVDHRADIFSASLVLFEFVTGMRLFAAEDVDRALREITDCLIPLPSSLNPAISSELELIVMKGLAKDPAQRYRSAGEMHRDIQTYLSAYYPSFIQRDFSDAMKHLFADSLREARERWEILSGVANRYLAKNGEGPPPGGDGGGIEALNRGSALGMVPETPAKGGDGGGVGDRSRNEQVMERTKLIDPLGAANAGDSTRITDPFTDEGEELLKDDGPGRSFDEDADTASHHELKRPKEAALYDPSDWNEPLPESFSTLPALRERLLKLGALLLGALLVVHLVSKFRHSDAMGSLNQKQVAESETPSANHAARSSVPAKESASTRPVPSQKHAESHASARKTVSSHYGKVEVVLNRSALVFLDNRLVGHARANKPMVLTVSPNRSHLLRFKNSAAHIDSREKIVVPGGHLTHRYYALTPSHHSRNRQPASRRRGD